MKKAELLSTIAKKTALTKVDVEKVYNEVFTIFAEELTKGEDVFVNGFGTFKVSARKARIGQNPATGEKVEIPASKAVSFKAASGLKDQINK